MRKLHPLHRCPPPRTDAQREANHRWLFSAAVLFAFFLACLSLLSGCSAVLAGMTRPPTEPANPRYCADTTRVMVATQPLTN